ncbi:MAG TPA: tetratricopeptide repeat protein [Gemmatimonadaceae bacterium]|nr:tetratricopeptide repeat protein [Gemmatimonadaceae bacterium]
MAKEGTNAGETFEDRADSFIDWARANGRKLTVGAVAIAALAVTVWGWRASAERKELSAQRRLAEARQAVEARNLPLAQSDLRQVIQRFDGTMASLQARLLLAQVMFDQQKVDSGVAVLREIGSPGVFASAYHALLAAGLEQAGRPAEAAPEYLRAADAALSAPEEATLRADAARAWEAAGNAEEARRVWGALAEDETGPLSGEAKVRLGELNAKALSSG